MRSILRRPVLALALLVVTFLIRAITAVAILTLVTILTLVAIEALPSIISIDVITTLTFAVPIAPATFTLATLTLATFTLGAFTRAALTLAALWAIAIVPVTVVPIAIVPARLTIIVAPLRTVVTLTAILSNGLIQLAIGKAVIGSVEHTRLWLLPADRPVDAGGLIVTVILAAQRLAATFTGFTSSTWPILAFTRLLLLLAISHDDASIMFGMLKIIFRKHRIA